MNEHIKDSDWYTVNCGRSREEMKTEAFRESLLEAMRNIGSQLKQLNENLRVGRNNGL
jgi:hypothetical protein